MNHAFGYLNRAARFAYQEFCATFHAASVMVHESWFMSRGRCFGTPHPTPSTLPSRIDARFLRHEA
jgi:hypothetical protein